MTFESPQPQPPVVAPTPPTPRNGFAIASLVAGIIALVVVLLVGILPLSGLLAIAGIILGILALRRWRRVGGHVMAHFGLWLSVAALLLSWIVSFSRAFA